MLLNSTNRRRIVRKLGFSLIRIVVMLLIGLALYLRLFENRLLFYPDKSLAEKPEIPYEEIHFTAADGVRLHGWFIPFENSKRVFLISHGNAGNIGGRAVMGEFVHAEFQGNVLMYDYRGYGLSEGTPSESGLYSDIRGAISYLHSRGFDSKSVFLIGQSMGAAVTVDLASAEPVGGIILEAAPSSVRALVRSIAFHLPLDYLMTARFDSLSKVVNIHAPIAVVHGRKDPVVPFALGQQLFDAIPGPKRFFVAEGEIHEGALMSLPLPELQEIRNFLGL